MSFSLLVRIYSTVNGHFEFEGIGSANIRLNPPVSVAFIP